MAASVGLICRRGRESAMSVCARHSVILTSAARWLSGRSPSVVKRSVEGFELSSVDSSLNRHPRPVVVLIGWLNAKRKHLRKYQEVYWDRGFDVLTMDVSPVHIVRPRAGIKYTKRLLKVLQENEDLASRQVVVHGFSIGAFIYTQLLLLLRQQRQALQQRQPLSAALLEEEEEGEAGDLEDRIAGLVMDSPAYMDHMCMGIANSLTSNPAVRQLINRSLLLYLAAFPRSVTHHYQESHRVFNYNRVPTLLLYSPQDLISSADTSERYAAEWRANGCPVSTCKFQGTSHVSHFRQHPEQYVAALHAFLQTLDLAQHKAPVDIPQAAMAAAAKV